MVAAKYERDPKAKAYLTNKIIKGGGGVWGETAMAAHPDLKQEEADLIVDWVLSLNKKETPSLPSSGSIVPTDSDMGPGNLMQITASYTDKGGFGIKPLSSANSVTLRSALINMPTSSAAVRVDIKNWNEHRAAFLNGDDGWLEFSDINLDGIKAIEFGYGIPQQLDKGYVLSLYQDSPNGTKIGELKLENVKATMFSKSAVVLENVKQGGHKLFMKILRVDKAETHRLATISMRLVPKK